MLRTNVKLCRLISGANTALPRGVFAPRHRLLGARGQSMTNLYKVLHKADRGTRVFALLFVASDRPVAKFKAAQTVAPDC